METYIYKMIALSAIFILLYFVFLEKEKNHRFKRFYLLSSALFSVLVPFYQSLTEVLKWSKGLIKIIQK